MNDEIHNLTDKEIKAIEDASSLIKKFVKYIEQVNLINKSLKKNLDEAIKAGDVTNEQKVSIRNQEEADAEYRRILDKLIELCKITCPERKGGACPDTPATRDSCKVRTKLTVLQMMRSAACGSHSSWDIIFDYACIGAFVKSAIAMARYDIKGVANILPDEVKELVKFAHAFNIA